MTDAATTEETPPGNGAAVEPDAAPQTDGSAVDAQSLATSGDGSGGTNGVHEHRKPAIHHRISTQMYAGIAAPAVADAGRQRRRLDLVHPCR